MNYQRPYSFGTPAVMNILIFNVLFFLATIMATQQGKDFFALFGLPWFRSENFHWWQIVTYMFMHANWMHIFFNMFALWMFGSLLELVMGSRRFLIYYFVTGIGAALTQWTINYIKFYGLETYLQQYITQPNPDLFVFIVKKYFNFIANPDFVESLYAQLKLAPTHSSLINQSIDALQHYRETLYNIPMVGASGAVFGILLAYGMIFPNDRVYIYFFLPMKAKYFVILYGILEFFLGISNRGGDNIAHFAHLGGMLFGLLLLLYWRKKR